MVKKKDKKKGGNSLADVFGKDTIEEDGGGWHTGGSAAMLLDDPQGPEELDMVPIHDESAGGGTAAKKGKKGKKAGSGGQGMDCSDGPKPSRPAAAITKVVGLGVVTHSLKRGDRTTNQKKRKAAKLVKAVARAEKAGVRIDTKQQKKQKKGELKHLY